jgi:hypothetical protein
MKFISIRVTFNTFIIFNCNKLQNCNAEITTSRPPTPAQAEKKKLERGKKNSHPEEWLHHAKGGQERLKKSG